MKLNYKHTKYAAYLGYITQAIVNNLPALLFVTFQREFGISLEKIGLLIAVNFITQIVVDFVAGKYVDKIGYRPCIIVAHVFSVIGLVGIGIFPGFFANPYIGLLIAALFGAIGGGLIEVLISPIVEALPGEEKEAAMSLLHSFYSWGQVGVVLLSTLFFVTVGIVNWKLLTLLWALVPFFTALLFTKVPMRTLIEEGEEAVPLRKLLTRKMFWLLFLLMICSGASEQAMSQWSSLFAEQGLMVPKTVGDLLGPCAFAVLMGVSRTIYGIFGSKMNLEKSLLISGFFCAVSYLAVVFAPHPLLSLAGCGMCGLTVGLMWPGVFSISAKTFPKGGTAMFALLALAGDVGCSIGPGMVGVISSATDRLLNGFLMAAVFPAILFLGILIMCVQKKKGKV